MFFGSIPALVTPFSGGRVAEDTFREFVEWQIAEGSNALVPCGTTGEIATHERRRASPNDRAAVETANDRVPVIAGCGTIIRPRPRSTWSGWPPGCRQQTRASHGCSLLQPAEPGRHLAAHFSALADASPLPIIVYNVPARTVADISVDTLAEIAAARADRRGQGRDRQSRPGLRATAGQRGGFHPAQRQRRHGARLSMLWAARVAFRSPPTSHRGCAPISRRRRARALGRSAEASGSALSAPRGAVHRRFPWRRSNMRFRRVRKGFPGELRLPLVEASEASKKAVDAALEHAGLI